MRYRRTIILVILALVFETCLWEVLKAASPSVSPQVDFHSLNSKFESLVSEVIQEGGYTEYVDNLKIEFDPKQSDSLLDKVKITLDYSISKLTTIPFHHPIELTGVFLFSKDEQHSINRDIWKTNIYLKLSVKTDFFAALRTWGGLHKPTQDQRTKSEIRESFYQILHEAAQMVERGSNAKSIVRAVYTRCKKLEKAVDDRLKELEPRLRKMREEETYSLEEMLTISREHNSLTNVKLVLENMNISDSGRQLSVVIPDCPASIQILGKNTSLEKVDRLAVMASENEFFIEISTTADIGTDRQNEYNRAKSGIIQTLQAFQAGEFDIAFKGKLKNALGMLFQDTDSTKAQSPNRSVSETLVAQNVLFTLFSVAPIYKLNPVTNPLESAAKVNDNWVTLIIATSPNSQRVAYATKERDKWTMVLDGERVGIKYDGIYNLVFSPNGKRFAFLAEHSGKKFAVVDGKEENERYDSAASLVFSPDSQRLAYQAVQDEKCFILVDSKPDDCQWDAIGSDSPKFTPDSKKVFYIGCKKEKYGRHNYNSEVVVAGQAPIPVPDLFQNISDLTFSPDSAHSAYAALPIVVTPEDKHKWSVIVDYKKQKDYEFILKNTIVFSPDSKRLAYAARSTKIENGVHISQEFVVVDGIEHEKFYTIYKGTIVFSPDSKQIAYVASAQGRDCLILNGRETASYDGIGLPSFSPDSQRLAYPASDKGKWFLVVDGKKQKDYDFIYNRALFSPNSRHVTYIVRQNGQMTVVLDETEGKQYDALGMGGWIIFDSPTRFHYLALRKDCFYLVEEKLME
jgi:Tol biopolymer transport system component